MHRLAERERALELLTEALRCLDLAGESMAAIHTSHAIEMLRDAIQRVRAEAG